MSSFFDYLNSINETKVNLMVDDISEREYNAYMVNRGLSYFSDTIFYANEMNVQRHVPTRMQYDFHRESIRKRKRFSKWFKASASEDIDVIQAVFGYSHEKARYAAGILTAAQIAELKSRTYKGGR